MLAICAIFMVANVSAQGNYNATTMGEKVYLETASWGQNKPYNNLCPTVGTNPTKTGCGPTAFAILCHYYKWPVSGSGSVTHNGETLDLSTHTYDYDNMLLNYSGSYTEEQATAVATLMRDLGYATKVGYGTSATSFSENITALKGNFSFTNSIFNPSGSGMNALYRSDAGDESFMQQLKECLNQGYPILFSSLVDDNNPETTDGRHIFILDGYTENNYFHFNFGWGGYGNGWYTLDNVRPDDESDYSTQQRAYLYVIPNRTKRTVTASVSPAGAGTVTVNGNANSAEVIENTYATLTATANNGYTFSHWSKNGTQVSTEKTYKAAVAAEGNDYVANFLTVGNNRVNISVTYNSSYGTVTYNGNVVQGTGITPYQNSEVTLVATPLDGYVFNGWTVTKGTNSTNYAGNELTFVATGDMSVEANFSTAIATYYISEATGTLENSTSSRYTTWSSSEVSGLYLTASYNSNAVEAISFNGDQVKLISAIYEDKTSTHKSPVTYTLSAPNGYVITAYSMTYKSSSSNYNMTVANAQMTQTLANRNEVLTLSATGLSAQNTSFTVSGANTNYAIQVQEFTVTLQKEGAEGGTGGSTPTPTTCTINVNAETGGSAYVNGTNASVTVNAGTNVTLQAYPDGTNYTFAGWYNGNSLVSSNNPYTFALNSDVTYTAKFNAVATTYNITAEASPQNAGNVAINGGTQSTVANIDATSGSTVSLQAYPNSGYEFAGWYNGTKKVSSNNPYSITATAAISYIASFQEVQQGGSSSDDLAGKYFRLKVYNDGRYMNVKNHTEHAQKVTAGGVNIAAKVEDSNAQIFFFEQSGNGYMLKDGDGYYIKGLEWSVDASSTTSGSVLLFEETAIEDVYYIKWNNTYKGDERYFKIGADSNGAGDHPYCDVAANQKETAAAKWVLEEVIPSLTVTFAGATWNNEASGWWVSVVTNTTPAVTVRTTDGTPKIGFSTFEVRHPYLLDGNSFTISLPANCKITGYRLGYKAHNLVSKSVTYTNGKESTGTLTITQSDERNTLTVTGLDNNEISFSVDDQSSQAGFIIESLEITYVENEFTPLPFKAEIEGWENDNPNTHLGTITIGGTPMKLTPEHLTASELTMPVVEGTTLAFTRKYRGFEFQGFYIDETSLGTNPTLTADNVAAINETTPLVAKFTATDDVTLFYDDDEFSYRIPAIVKTVKDDKHKLIAISDYRHSFDDIGRDNHKTGTTQVDLVIRTSEDNGATWTAKQTIAEGSQHFGYGDAAAVANGQDVLVMAVAGNVFYAYADSVNPQQAYRIYSNDNGVTWEKEDISSNMESLFPDYHGLFFGSGKLAVDPDFNGSGNARVYGAILMKDSQGERNYVLYSDNWGKTWNILGNAVAARQNEPKVEILPNGQILLSARRGGGRTFNVFTYTDKANNAGTWSTVTDGCDNGGNGTNGEIILLDAKRPNGTPTKILLQSQPYGSDRRNVSIWYKEISANETYTASSIASGWTMGKQVSTQLSAYSAMCLQENGEIALFFEEAPCYGDDHTKGYSMVYVPLTIEEITGENFLNPNAVVETVTVDVTLTDEQGNTYTHQFDYLPGDAAAIDAALKEAYPFITELGEGNLQGSDTYYTYTNTVTLPFKVSNANTTVWHNIYWPANDTSAGKYYPIYLLSTAEGDTYVAKKTETKHYGESSYNTLNWADELSWAVYSVDGTLNFKFKNKLTGKFMAVNGVVSTGSTNNVIYTDEANATTFTLEKYTGTNTYYGNYAIKSVYNGTTGYVCNTSVGHANATNYTGTDHAGAWAKFVEAPDYQAIIDALTANVAKFGAGDGNYTDNNDINAIKAIIENIETTPLNTLNTHTETVQNVKESYREVVLTVNDTETATVPGTISITVNGSTAETVNNKFVPANATVSILATANPGYRFVNWTRPAAAASAAARTAEARNSNVVSDQNPYTVTVSEALSLVANFEQIVVNATLTDAQGNTYNVQLSGFTAEITKEAVADKLREAYPYITLGTTDQEGNVIDFGVLNIDGTAYTYTNRVELPFKVTNTTYLWHNIYYPSNNTVGSKPGCPNYIAALNEDEVVDMAASEGYYYGDNPTYNTKDGGNSICWAIYNVNNSFEFIFKSRVTGKYIKVESVSSSTTNNVKFVENAEDATAFTLLKDADSYNGDYALVANVNNATDGEKTGYLCATSSSKNYLTHFDRTNHQGAWVKFVEAPDYFSKIMDLGIVLGLKFGAGDGKCVIAGTNIEEVDNAMQNSGSITLNKLNDYAARMEAALATENPTWFNVTTSAENGTAYITLENDDPELTRKRVPGGYELTVKATPATGYHFTGWTMNGTAIEGATEEHTFTVTEATTIVASFAINTYTVNVTAGENGSVTVTNDVNGETVDINGKTVDFATVIKIEATPNDGYKFIGWYNGEELQHSINPHEFAINHDINYTARFEKNEAGSTTNKYVIKIDAILTDGETAANNAEGNVQAIIHGIGLDWATSAEVVENATVELVAISDHNRSAYLFEGWYKNGELVSTALSYKVAVTETVTYEARFAKGKVIKLTSNNKPLCLPNMPTYTDGSEVAGTITDLRAVVRDGEELLISIDDSVIANFTGEGYRVANWTDKDGNEVAGKNVYRFTITVNGDNTYKVNLEKDTYTLTVSTEGTMGTVHIGDGTETSVTVNNGGTAKITATPNSGYKFVNWTLNGVVVSTENPYNVPAITDNVQYVAVFAEAAALNAGYYRIGYDYPVAAANAGAARTGAARAAGDTYTYAVNYGTGTSENVSSSRAQEWVYTNNTNEPTLTLSATFGDTPVYAINMGASATANPKLYTHNLNSNTETPVKYTLAVSEDYIITNYSFEYFVYHNNYGFTINGTSPATKTWLEFSSGDVNAQTAEFTISSTHNSSYMIVKNFTVTIQEVENGEGEGGEVGGGETPETPTEPTTTRYYMQSVACGVSGGNNLQNALKMTQETGAASIFYYADSKLLSYDKGTYIKEDGGTRGLQEVGVYGNVEIKIVDTNENEENICTIKAPSYLHAMNGTTYYVDHCGSNEGTNAHANHNFIIEEVTTLPVTIGTALHATFYAPVAVAIPEGVTAYVLKAENIPGIETYAWMTSLKNGVIPANTGVIIKGAQGTHYFNIVENSDEARAEAVGNVLSGTVAKTKITQDAYILANREGKIGLYPVAKNSYLDDNTNETTVRFTNNSHKAYLPVKDDWFGEELKRGTGFRFVYDDEETTGIDEFETELEDTIYDLQGRKLSEITEPGIYIVGGKKVWIK